MLYLRRRPDYVRQRDLVKMLTRFRLPRFVYAADIHQMLRQIKVHPKSCHYQGIVWQNSSSESIQNIQLTTVIY